MKQSKRLKFLSFVILITIPMFFLFQNFTTIPGRPSFAWMNVHTLENLRGLNGEKGCDIWNPNTINCRWAARTYCAEQGYEGGYGPYEWHKSVAHILCLSKGISKYTEINYQGLCTANNPSSLFCENLTNIHCQRLGYKAAGGVVGYNANVIATLCIEHSENVEAVRFSSLAELRIPAGSKCNLATIVSGNECQRVSHLFCKSKGYSTGFNIFDFDGVSAGRINCLRTAEFVDTGIFAANALGIDGYLRPARIGKMILGGASFAGDVNYIDGIINNFSFPILITGVTTKSSYTGIMPSRDMCFALNRSGILQYDDNDDGEIMCTYSNEALNDPKVLFRPKSGYLIKPGEKMMFQGTPQWNSGGAGHYVGAEVSIAPVTAESIPLRRIRFPKWDASYPPNTFVHAGCSDLSCKLAPPLSIPPPGKINMNSNWWYFVNTKTAIRGISFFNNTPRLKGCLRVVQSGGANIRTPWCFDFRDLKPGPSLFNNVFGAAQNGSSFVTLDIDVPAGALIGLDFELPLGGDLGVYVYLDQRRL